MFPSVTSRLLERISTNIGFILMAIQKQMPKDVTKYSNDRTQAMLADKLFRNRKITMGVLINMSIIETILLLSFNHKWEFWPLSGQETISVRK